MSAIFNLWAKLTKSKAYRRAYVASYLKRSIPFQIAAIRKAQGWSQSKLAKACGLTQGVISRAEDPNYGNLTFNTILSIAGGFDVAFVGQFVSFSELAKRVESLSEESVDVPSFAKDAEPQPDEREKLLEAVKLVTMGRGLGDRNAVFERFRKLIEEESWASFRPPVVYRFSPLLGASTEISKPLTQGSVHASALQMFRPMPTPTFYPATNSSASGSLKNLTVEPRA